ncbi:redoxin domain-containing protein [candidate division WOR-3 bacterium]|uniref:Redoxin domain-containing protein n=1 Tax=candidate division WOR-3 bacterium TaxID=2052148 RepID=A0A9D5QD81_UNCW3|nr:redoxin domain-containing protein [candidate division WOR-3 bacterium]MBD3365458.1 redoxin domain-containing protein [candidate division WOR-3 bacterium]
MEAMLKRIITLIVVVVSASTAGKVPDFQADDLEGRQVTLDSLLGEGITIISFWGVTCGPCKAELSFLDSLYEVYADSGLSVVAVNTDSRRQLSKVAPMVTSMGWDFTVITDPDGKLVRLFKFQAIPYSVYVNPEKEIIKTTTGYTKKDEREITETVLEALHADTPAFSLGDCKPVIRSSSVRIKVSQTTDLNVFLADSSGNEIKPLHEGALEPGSHTIDIKVEELEAGAYQVIADDGRTRIIKELQIIE